MSLLPFSKQLQKFKYTFNKISFLSGLPFKTQLSIVSLILLIFIIPLTVFGIKTINDLRSRAVTNCSVTATWPPNPNRPTDCTQNLTISWGSPGFAVALAKGGALVAAQADISGTSYTFSGLQASTTYHYVVCTPNCGTGKKIKEGDANSSSSGTLTVSWYYTARLTESGNLGAVVATRTSTTTSVTFTGLKPDHNYDYYVCTVDCGTGVLVTSGTKKTNVCPITYKVKLTLAGGDPNNVVAQSGYLPETVTSYTFRNSAIQPSTNYVYYVYSPATSTSVYYQNSATSDNACATTSAPGPPTLNQPQSTGSFSNPTFSWGSATNATYYKVLVKPNDNNFSAGGFWFKQTSATSLAWSNGAGWSSNNIGAPPSTFSPGITYWWLAWSCNDSTGGCSLSGAAAPVSFSVIGEPSIINDLTMKFTGSTSATFNWTWTGNCVTEQLTVGTDGGSYTAVLNSAVKSDNVNICTTNIPKHTMNFSSSLIAGKAYYAVITVSFPPVQASNIASATVPTGGQSPGPPTLNQPQGTGSFSNPTFSWGSATNATYYKVLVKPNDNNFSAGGFWFKQTSATSLAWSNGAGWSSNNIGAPPSTFSPGITYWWLAWSCNDSTGGCSLGGAAAPISFGVSGGGAATITDLSMSFTNATTANFTWTWTGTCVTEQLTVGTDGGSYTAILNSAVKSNDINICSTAIPKHTMNFANALTAGKTYYAVITVSLPPVQASNIASAAVPGGAVVCSRLSSDLYLVSPEDKKVLDQNKPLFSWSEYAGLGDSYWVDLSEQPFGTPGEWWWYSGPHIDVPNISYPASWNTSLAAGHAPPNSGLKEGIVYYWRVSARHPDCPGFIKFSNRVNSFTFKAPVVGLLPATNLTESIGPCKTNNKVEVTFKWVPSISSGAIEQWLDFSTKNDNFATILFNARQESPTTSTFTIQNIINGKTTYYWRVNTKFNNGEWRPSTTRSFTTPNCTAAVTPPTPTSGVSSPTDIQVTNRSCNQNDELTSVGLSWKVTPDVTVVNVILYDVSKPNVIHNTNIAAPTSTIKYNDLENNKHFKAFLYAYNSKGEKSDVTVKEFDSPNCPGRFSLTGVGTECGNKGTVTAIFTWQASNKAQGYIVDLSTDTNPSTRWTSGHFINNVNSPDRVPAATSFTWKGIKSNTQHWWRVYAYIGEFGRHSNTDGTFKQDCHVPLPHEELGVPGAERIQQYIYQVAGDKIEPLSGRNLADVMVEIVIGESYFDLCAIGKSGEIGIFGFLKSLWIGSGFWRNGIDSGSGFRNGPKTPPCWTIPGEDEPFHSVEWLRPPEPWSPLDGNLWDPYDQILGAAKIISNGGACNWNTYKMNNGYWRCD